MSDTPTTDLATTPAHTVQLQPLQSQSSNPISPALVEQAKGLSPESRATMMATFARFYGDEAVQRAFDPATPASTAPKIDLANVNAAKLFPEAGSGLSDERARASVEHLLANSADKQQTLNELGRLGVVKATPEQLAAAEAAKVPIVNPMIEPGRSASDYKLDWVGLRGFDELEPKSLAQIDGEMKVAAHAIGLSVGTASSIIKAAIENSNEMYAMRSPSEIKIHEQTQLALLKNAVGTDAYEATIQKAASSFNRIPEVIRSKMLAARLPKSAAFLLELSRAEDRFQARQKKV